MNRLKYFTLYRIISVQRNIKFISQLRDGMVFNLYLAVYWSCSAMASYIYNVQLFLDKLLVSSCCSGYHR